MNLYFLICVLISLIDLAASSSIDLTENSEKETTTKKVTPSTTTTTLETTVRVDQRKMVLGGSEAELARHFYMAAIKNDIENEYICGGTLISPFWVLTAATCVLEDTTYKIEIGRNNLTNANELLYAETHETDYIVAHPDHDSDYLHDDIALIKLKTRSNFPPVILDECQLDPSTLEPIFPDDIDGGNVVENEVDVTALGFGKMSQEGEHFVVLNEADVRTITYLDCRAFYYEFPSFIQNNMVCTLSPNLEDRDICLGDLGGALILKSDEDPVSFQSPFDANLTQVIYKDIQLGINLFSRCDGTMPSVYTYVYNYLGFIKCVINGGTSCGISNENDDDYNYCCCENNNTTNTDDDDEEEDDNIDDLTNMDGAGDGTNSTNTTDGNNSTKTNTRRRTRSNKRRSKIFRAVNHFLSRLL